MIEEVIQGNYSEAVKDIKDQWLLEPDSNEWYKHILSLPPHLQTVYTIVILENQLVNGGFYQYYSNLYGQFTAMTIAHLNRIGLPKKAKILRKAFSVIKEDDLSEDLFRDKLVNGQLENIFTAKATYEQLDKLDDQYFDSEEDTFSQLYTYLVEDGNGA